MPAARSSVHTKEGRGATGTAPLSSYWDIDPTQTIGMICVSRLQGGYGHANRTRGRLQRRLHTSYIDPFPLIPWPLATLNSQLIGDRQSPRQQDPMGKHTNIQVGGAESSNGAVTLPVTDNQQVSDERTNDRPRPRSST